MAVAQKPASQLALINTLVGISAVAKILNGYQT